MIGYNEYDLLELFESEPKLAANEDVGMYKYSRKDEHGFTFELYMSVYDEYCSLSLYHKDLKTSIFDIGFDNINDIKCKENRLIIEQAENPKNIVVHFKPNYTLAFEDRPY